MELLFHQLGSIGILVGNANEDDCPALLVGKVNSFTGLPPTHSEKHSLSSIPSVILIVSDLLQTSSLLEKYLLPYLFFESAQGRVEIVFGIFDIFVIGQNNQDTCWDLSQ